MILTKKEIDIISDKEFLITKNSVINKIHELFENVRKSLNESIDNSDFKFPPKVDINYGKIFRGENYQLLPYVNLDYPKLFEGNDIFTYRTMFLWGSFFSSTFHLSGSYVTQYKNIILTNIINYLDTGIYICVNDSPWHYHYGKDNYIQLTLDNLHLLETHPFIKLSMKYKLNDYDQLPILAANYLDNCLRILS